MSDEDRDFDSWKEVIKDYIDSLEDSDKKDEYLDEVIANYYYKILIKAKNQSDNKELDREINKISKIKITAKNKQKLKDHYLSFIENSWIDDNRELFLNLEKKKDFYNIWINRAIFSPKGILPATHVAKLSHSSNSASSVFDKLKSDKNTYLTTSSIREKIIDGAYPDAKYSKIVKFFMLNYNSRILGQEILQDNKESLVGFSENEDELRLWLEEFKKIIDPKPKGDFLIKQIYFPVELNNYHSLIVLKSSTLLHHIFLKLFEKTSRKKEEKIFSAIKNEKYLPDTKVDLVNMCKILTTQSQPQNVSVLNGKRGGVIRLFSSMPPTWQTQLKPPTNKVSLFFDIYNSTIKTELDYLRDFLLRFKRLDLSIKDPKRKRHLIRWVENIIDECLFYIGTIQNLPAGWSATDNIRLKPEHQYLLDSYRLDDAYQTERQSTQWQSVICADFSLWLNRQLRGKEFTPQAEHTRLWKKLMEQALREYMEPIEQEIKQSIKEAV